jgi:DNA-binding response OmpR family regulator
MTSLKDIKILYIEDEEFIRKNAIEYLNFYCDNVYEACDGLDGYEKYKQIKPNIIICDIMMPNLNGLELIEKIRKEDKATQIIVATARIDTEFLLKAVELRLIKYLTKPITEDKLLPVLNEALKYIKQEDTNILNFEENYKFDILNKTLFSNEKIVKLTKKEILFLEVCTKNKNRAVTYNELENYVWDGYMTSDAMRSVVKELRRKLPKNTLENISGIGYKINTL